MGLQPTFGTCSALTVLTSSVFGVENFLKLFDFFIYKDLFSYIKWLIIIQLNIIEKAKKV